LSEKINITDNKIKWFSLVGRILKLKCVFFTGALEYVYGVKKMAVHGNRCEMRAVIG